MLLVARTVEIFPGAHGSRAFWPDDGQRSSETSSPTIVFFRQSAASGHPVTSSAIFLFLFARRSTTRPLALPTVRRKRRVPRPQRRQLGWRRLELRRWPRLQRPPSWPHAPPWGLELPRGLRPRVRVQVQLLPVRRREARGSRPRVRPEARRRLPARRRRRELERPPGRLSPRRSAVICDAYASSFRRDDEKTSPFRKTRRKRVFLDAPAPSRARATFVSCSCSCVCAVGVSRASRVSRARRYSRARAARR